MELEWKIFPGFTTLGILSRRESKNMIELQCELEQTTTLCTESKRNTEKCEKKQLQLRIMLSDSRSDVDHFWDVDQRRNGTEFALRNQTEIGTKLLNK